jgi:hypothetical protein
MEPVQLAATLAAVVVLASMISVEVGLSVALIELAGAEIDPDDFRERFGAAMWIGVVSFVGPFVAASLVTHFLLGWTVKAALIAGTALSTTSLAVVYAVLVESGLSATRVGGGPAAGSSRPSAAPPHGQPLPAGERA